MVGVMIVVVVGFRNLSWVRVEVGVGFVARVIVGMDWG